MAGTARNSGVTTLFGVAALLMLTYFALPLGGLLAGQSPGRIAATLSDPLVRRAARNTLLTAIVSTTLATVFGVPLGYWLARTDRPGVDALTALVVFPLVLPPVVSGMLLVGVLGPAGLAGLTGLSLLSTHAGIVAAQVFVAAPFVVLTARSAFAGIDRRIEEAARTLGASDWATFRRVTLPLASRGVLAGVTLAFARAAGEFGATLLVAYFPRTLPVQIWVSFQRIGLDGAFPVALVLVVVAVLALGVLRWLGTGLFAVGGPE